LETALAIIGWLMMAATAIPLLRAEHWWIRIFDFPRLQITIVFTITFIAYLLVREDPSLADNAFLLALSVGLVYQLLRMWPYTPLHSEQVKRVDRQDAQSSLSVLISNVRMENRASARLRSLIREYDPDIILAVETDTWWEEQLQEFEHTHSHVLKQPQNNTYGMLLYSRLTLIDPQIKFLVQHDVPSIHVSVKLRSDDQVVLRCLHPRPPAPGENDRSTERDAELLLVAKELQGKELPSIVVGDLNDVAWSRTNELFQEISGLLDPRVGRGLFSTFNANWPFIRFPLDHAFLSHHFRLAAFKVLPHCGSDHFPVFVRVCLSPAAPDASSLAQCHAASSEEQEAKEKISRATSRP
jgi:endonuclease/exonuclease/phosphatase (EEP) superfamily protein YafD